MIKSLSVEVCTVEVCTVGLQKFDPKCFTGVLRIFRMVWLGGINVNREMLAIGGG